MLVHHQEISAVSKLKIKCLFLLKTCVLKVLSAFRQLLQTRFVLEVVMVKLFCFMLIRTSVKPFLKHKYLVLFMVYLQARMEFKF